ncbi:MAG: hypothetical protein ACYDD4_06450 [Acidimicrobiales bacterium]
MTRYLAGALFAAGLSLGVAGSASAMGSVHRGTVHFTSSSAPFTGSSPATTQPNSSSAGVTTTVPSTIPIAHTGEAWGSGWFAGLLVMAMAGGALCLEPFFRRRRRLAH